MLKHITLTLFLFISTLNLALAKDTLRIGYCMEPPFVVTSKEGTLSGPSVWLWENIAEDNSFDFKYVKLSREDLLKALKNNTVDAALSPLTITSKRYQSINFTSPYHIEHASLLVHKESSLQKIWRFVSSFFSINFWRALGALAFVIFVFGALIWMFERKQNKDEFHNGIRGIWEGFWWSAVTMTTVGYGDKSPKTIGGRIVSLIWMFTAVIIISGFTAGIASSLTVNNISSSNNKIADFKDKRLATIQGTATDEWLKNNFFAKKKAFETMQQAVDALSEQEVDAIAYDHSSLQSVIKEDTLSQYQLIDIRYNPQFFAFGLSKNLPDSLVESINYSMLSNIERMDWKVLLLENDLK